MAYILARNPHSLSMGPITDLVATSPGILKARSEELDRELLNSPVAISQKVEIELIRRAKTEAPWLIPMIVKI